MQTGFVFGAFGRVRRGRSVIAPHLQSRRSCVALTGLRCAYNPVVFTCRCALPFWVKQRGAPRSTGRSWSERVECRVHFAKLHVAWQVLCCMLQVARQGPEHRQDAFRQEVQRLHMRAALDQHAARCHVYPREHLSPTPQPLVKLMPIRKLRAQAAHSRRRCGRVEPRRGADVAVQMRKGGPVPAHLLKSAKLGFFVKREFFFLHTPIMTGQASTHNVRSV